MRALLAAVPLLLSGCFLQPFYAEPLPVEAELLKAKTADGWDIALIHYKPVGAEKGPPVLLCHGLSANFRNMDVDADHSIARWFAAQGRHAFAMSLRGTGDSDFPDPDKGRPYAYTVDTFAEQDLPAAIAKVKEVTGAKKLDYAGHSMGGLIAYVYLARGGTELNAVTILGSPTRFVYGGFWDRMIKDYGRSSLASVDNLNMPGLAHLIMPVHGEIEGPVELLLYNPENVNVTTWKRLIAVGLGTMGGGVLRQFALWFEKDRMVSADGQTDYTAALAKVTTPVFVVAGKLDRIAPVPAVKDGFERLQSDKQWLIAGEENGFQHDYGHMDLIVGDRAPKELFPRIAAFFEAHD